MDKYEKAFAMTYAEAAKILKEIEYPVNGDNKEYRDMAFKMAIEALEAQTESQATMTDEELSMSMGGLSDG